MVDFDQLKRDMEEFIENQFDLANPEQEAQMKSERLYHLKTVGIVCEILKEYDKRKQEYIAI